jgi:Sigma-70 region 2
MVPSSRQHARNTIPLMREIAYTDALNAFFGVWPRLFGIGYRMLGSVAEAEDLVQDVWMRWQSTDRKAVQDASAYLATITTRLAIDLMQSARSRREAYFGIWLPEPVDSSGERTAVRRWSSRCYSARKTCSHRASCVYPYCSCLINPRAFTQNRGHYPRMQ